jgi:hypothetical protein
MKFKVTRVGKWRCGDDQNAAVLSLSVDKIKSRVPPL